MSSSIKRSKMESEYLAANSELEKSFDSLDMAKSAPQNPTQLLAALIVRRFVISVFSVLS